MRAALAAIAAAVAMGGCSLGDGEDGAPRPDAERTPEPAGEEATIRAWNAAVNDGRFDRAAAYFAAGAIVEQAEEIRLPDRAAAEAFNRSLPCKADVTDVEDEGATVIAAFRLRAGSGGPCDGSARVRFRFRDGKFSEWRQLAEPDLPRGPVAALD